MISWMATHEQAIIHSFIQVFKSVCNANDSLFVDSGANEASFSLMAAAFGCEVLAIEPQPLCVSWIEQFVNANSFGRKVKIIESFLGPNTSHQRKVPMNSCKGTFQVTANSDRS